jgi:hypothetical protein
MGIIKSFDEFASRQVNQVEEAKSLTDKAQSYVSMKIAKLKKEGYPDDQAAAIAYSMARKRGFEVGEAHAGASADDINEVGDEVEQHMQAKLERPLDAPYVVQNIMGYVDELMKDDTELAMELKQVARSLRAKYPNNRDISIYDVYDVAEEVGMDEEVLDRVKQEIEAVWTGM